jgi:hypothetical protein
MNGDIIGTRGPVAHDCYNISFRDISELLEVAGHMLASVDANRVASRIELRSVHGTITIGNSIRLLRDRLNPIIIHEIYK